MKLTKNELRKIIREAILDEARHRRPYYNRRDYSDSGSSYMDAKEHLRKCFETLDRYDVTKSSSSPAVQDQVWQMIRDHYGI